MQAVSKILFVDDEPRITNSLKAIFRRGYEVLVANSASEALELLSANKVDVLVSDQRMPNMLGHELLAKVKQQFPSVMRILLTGYMDKEAIIESINEGDVFRFVNKPWVNDELKETIAYAAKVAQTPAYTTAPTANSTDSSLKGSLFGDKAILMLEKDEQARYEIRKFCKAHDIMIYAAQTPEQAIQTAASRPNIAAAVIAIDQDPANSLATINLLKKQKTDVVCIALAEQSSALTVANLINQGQIFRYFEKPISQTVLADAVQAAYEYHDFLVNNQPTQARHSVDTIQSSFWNNLRLAFGIKESATQNI
ncbi:MAG: response regulator [Pseudomonadota bacterium]